MTAELYPYVVFLPSEEKNKVLSAIFGSKAAVDLLKFSLEQGVAKSIYQKDLVRKLNFSNKTIIENLKALVKLGVLDEAMEKNEKEGRIIWVKAYKLTDLGKWFALLMADEEQISEEEKAEIMKTLFRIYVKMIKGFAEELHIDKSLFEDIFREEMNAPSH